MMEQGKQKGAWKHFQAPRSLAPRDRLELPT